MIDIEQLSVQYPDGRMALEGITCQIGADERIALLGANGAGKSSLLLCLVGLAPVTSGRVIMDGEAISPGNIKNVRQKVGLLFQNPDDQLFCARVRDDIAFGPQNMGWTAEEISVRTQAVMALLGISHLADYPPHRLSGGEKQKVALAGVLVMEPRIILFDEPTAFLDPRAKRELTGLFLQLNQGYIIATHDLDFARKTCSRAILLSEGRIIRSGPIHTVLDDQDLLVSYGLS